MSNQQQVKKRVAFVLIDGLGDVSLPRLGLKTPLQAAKIPNLDAIASAGVNGLMDPVEVGLGCGSDTAHLSLLGYDPRVYYRGRGAFESMGAGLAMSPGDIAFKSNFATLDEETGVVISRRADRHFEEEGPVLCAALDGMKLPSFPQYEVWSGRKGPKLSGNISGTDPLKDNRLLLKAEALDDTDEARHTANVVNELSKEISRILISHPLNAKRASEGKNIANIVLLRGCGIRIEVPSFEQKHGLWPCMVAPTKIIAGLGLSLGIDILEAPGATGDYRTLLTSKASAIAKALAAPLQSCPNVFVPGADEHKPGRPDGYDFGFLHIKAIDDAGHDKASLFKVKGLEAVDRAIGQLAKFLWRLNQLGNFSTPCVSLETILPHTIRIMPIERFCWCREDLADNVAAEQEEAKGPFQAFAGDSVYELNEIAAARGCLGRFPGGEMMGVIKQFLKLDA
ncbi:hypothetical protein G4B88_030806 [Cannabis sativa]|uniref:Metalloenzyme domain-containing protein n=1 Tax=Cannabis sativa TaxID=3483 RepID=A0A7J6E4B8_CANSA|nr:hypothetical protein G4B88_028454 [Cannabis sativa]KAF4371702.1 hypothetical protein G4B88_030806 [Cannabis sativa]